MARQHSRQYVRVIIQPSRTTEKKYLPCFILVTLLILNLTFIARVVTQHKLDQDSVMRELLWTAGVRNTAVHVRTSRVVCTY